MPEDKEKEKYEKAKKRVKEIKDFYTHLIVYLSVMVVLVIINITTMYASGYRFYWFIFPMAGWGFGLFWHAMGVFVFSKTKTSAWEKRKMEQILKEMDDNKNPS